jgi:hypothetical protein
VQGARGGLVNTDSVGCWPRYRALIGRFPPSLLSVVNDRDMNVKWDAYFDTGNFETVSWVPSKSCPAHCMIYQLFITALYSIYRQNFPTQIVGVPKQNSECPFRCNGHNSSPFAEENWSVPANLKVQHLTSRYPPKPNTIMNPLH